MRLTAKFVCKYIKFLFSTTLRSQNRNLCVSQKSNTLNIFEILLLSLAKTVYDAQPYTISAWIQSGQTSIKYNSIYICINYHFTTQQSLYSFVFFKFSIAHNLSPCYTLTPMPVKNVKIVILNVPTNVNTNLR